jgi:hypothetical protein
MGNYSSTIVAYLAIFASVILGILIITNFILVRKPFQKAYLK